MQRQLDLFRKDNPFHHPNERGKVLNSVMAGTINASPTLTVFKAVGPGHVDMDHNEFLSTLIEVLQERLHDST